MIKRFALCCLVLTTCLSLDAQSEPPRPGVRVRQLPSFFWGTWPADFNGDGNTDLIGASLAGTFPTDFELTVALGRGDGTFTPPTTLGIHAAPMGVADFNGDGQTDVVVSGVAILPGNGNGTFGVARAVTGAPARPATDVVNRDALVADFNGDGKRDLGLLAGQSVDIYPGNGDFTFGPKMSLPTGGDHGTNHGIVADFNGDGRPDLAVTDFFGSVDVFINRGGLLFSTTTISIPGELWGITAGDLNRDGRRDLLVAGANSSFFDWNEGHLFTALGNGDGTFQTVVDHATGVDGSVTVVVGDFNADGVLDAATGNRSWVNAGDFPCAPTFQYWDSVTILPGKGNGTFAAPATFHLDYTNEDSDYRDSHNALKTSDVNGDGRTDLIMSRGAIVLNVVAGANRPPTVSGGPDRSSDSEGFARMEATVADADHDYVNVVWTDPNGAVVTTSPEFCDQFEASTTRTVTVTDARGASTSDTVGVFVPSGPPPFLNLHEPDAGETISTSAPFRIEWDAGFEDARFSSFDVWSSSDDGQTFARIAECASLSAAADQCVWNAPGPVSEAARVQVRAYTADGSLLTFANSDRFRIVAGPRTSLPDGWFNRDIGTVGAAGNATFDGSTFTVRGSGADIWGTADEFHYALTLMGGDFDFTARVVSVQNVNQWTKAGLMVRNHLGAGAAHVSLFATPTTVKGISSQGRGRDGGLSTERARALVAPPVWLKVMRRGISVYMAYRKAITDPWIFVPGSNATFGAGVQVGFAVSSHVDGPLATARFDNVSLTEAPTWQNQDIGAVGLAGRKLCCFGDPSRTFLGGSGADIWGTADAFHYEFTQWFGDGSITARVRSVEGTHVWAKAGVMFRDSTAAGSRHVMAIVSPGRGLAMQYRASANGITANAGLKPGVAPEWVRLTRRDDTFTGEASNDGVTWVTLGTATVPMNDNLLVGLPVTSHNNGTLATAVFDDVVVRR